MTILPSNLVYFEKRVAFVLNQYSELIETNANMTNGQNNTRTVRNIGKGNLPYFFKKIAKTILHIPTITQVVEQQSIK